MGGRVSVLVVEDDPDLRDAYADCLREAGYEVLVAEHGLRAVELARDHRPQAILMDLALPVMDGWEATRILKRDGLTASIPVIAITGQAHKASEGDARSAGCDAIVEKPCARETLVGVVGRFTAG